MIQAKSYFNPWVNEINGIPLPLSFYYLNDELASFSAYKNVAPIAQSGVVLSMLYTPFLKIDRAKLDTLDYDYEYFGYVKPNGQVPTSSQDEVPQVFKLKPELIEVVNANVGNPVKLFGTSGKVGISKDWRNEGKLFQYPYSYLSFTDYVSNPLTIIPALMDSRGIQGGNIQLKVRQRLSMFGSYTLYVPYYKGDVDGKNEGMFTSNALDLPTGSSAYAQFMSTTKGQWNAQQESARRNENVNMWTNAVSGVTSAVGSLTFQGAGSVEKWSKKGNVKTVTNTGASITADGGGISGVGGAVMGMIGTAVERKNRIENANAKISDLQNAPRSVTMPSADILSTIDRSDRGVWCMRYHIRKEYLNKLCDFFTLYGYKQNKLMPVHLDKRKYFTYVKTLDANIVGHDIDKTELEQIKDIFNKGIRFWHRFNCKQNGITIGDYHLDNTEV